VTGHNQLVGEAGETLAAQWYEASGYQILERNWRTREGELDLILRRNRTLVICEVKTRSSDAFGLPAEAVNRAKRERIRHLTGQYLQTTSVRFLEVRFDVAAILGDDVQIIESAF